MRNRTIAGRVAAVGLAASVSALGTTVRTAAAAAGDGTGSGTVTTSVLDAALGDVLGMKLLEDVAGSTTDAKLGTVGATSRLRQLQITGAVPSLNQVIGEHQVTAPGGTADVTTSLVDLGALGVGPVVDGTLDPVVLKALSTPGMATSSTAKVLEGLSLLGGLADLGAVDAADSTASGATAAEAARTLSVDSLSALDLGRLLQGLDLEVVNLPLSVVSGLVTSLGVPVDLRGAASLQALVTSLTAGIEALQTAPTTTITAELIAALAGLGLPAPLQPVLDGATDAALTAMQLTLTNLIGSTVDLLESATLFELSALDISTAVKAAGTVAGSTATATGTIGSLKVGSTDLGGVNLGAAAGAVDAYVTQVQAALDAALAPLGFSDLLTVKLFDRATGVTEASGTVKAVSSITGLAVTLVAPALGVLAPLDDPEGGFGTFVPEPTENGRTRARVTAHAVAPNPLTGVLEAALGEASLLSEGLVLRVGTVQSQALHAVPASAPVAPQSPTPAAPQAPAPQVVTPLEEPTSLPRTGQDQAPLVLLAMGLILAGTGAHRLARRIRA
jgi:hypothetical protein